MEREQIKSKLIELLGEQLELSTIEIIDEDEPLENYSLNSVAILKILMDIEKKFPISVEDDDFDERNFVTLGAMIDFIERKL